MAINCSRLNWQNQPRFWHRSKIWTENQNPQRFSLFGCMHRLNIALLYCRCNQMRFSDICGTKSLTFISRMSKQRNKIPDAGDEEQCGICGDPCHSILWAWSRGIWGWPMSHLNDWDSILTFGKQDFSYLCSVIRNTDMVLTHVGGN